MIELGFVNRFYALARFFVTFLGAFTAFPAPRALELAPAFRSGFLAPFEAGFPTFREALAPLQAALAPQATDLEALALVWAIRLAAPGFLDALASTAPIAARMRLISRVTCSMVIMPSTVSSLRRSE
jgi:hypothetical protein